MSEEIKFTEDEIKNLKELQKGYLEIQSQFGQVSIAVQGDQNQPQHQMQLLEYASNLALDSKYP